MRALPLLAALLVMGCQTTFEPPDGPGDDLGPSLIGIGLAPSNPKVTLGEELQLTATGFYSDQTTVEITDTVEWASSDDGVLTVGAGLDVEGLAVSQAAGTAQVRASFFEVESNLITVMVTEAVIEELKVSPASGQIAVDDHLQLAAEASFSDGSRGNVSGSVRWLSDDAAVVTVDSGGKLTGKGPGTTTVTAIYDQGLTSLEAEPVAIEVVSAGTALEQADVRIVGFDTVSTADGVTATVEVRNSGSAPASGFWVDVWLNRTAAPDPPPTSGDAYEYVELLEPAETIEIPIPLEASPGTYTMWALVDSFANVAEGSLGENNNVWGPETVSVSSGGGPIGPELAVTYVQPFVQSDQVLYVIDVTNTGDEVAEDFAVGVFADPGFPPAPGDSPDEQQVVTSLSPGGTSTLTIILRALPEDPWQSYVLVDVYDAITEPNEGNNVSGVQVFP